MCRVKKDALSRIPTEQPSCSYQMDLNHTHSLHIYRSRHCIQVLFRAMTWKNLATKDVPCFDGIIFLMTNFTELIFTELILIKVLFPMCKLHLNNRDILNRSRPFSCIHYPFGHLYLGARITV